MLRASQMIMPTVKSETASALRPGALKTSIPFSRAYSLQTFSMPPRSTPIAFSFGHASTSSRVTVQNCVTITSASAHSSKTHCGG